MSKPLCRGNGRFQWDADVAATRQGQPREKVKITVFCDTRYEAVDAACNAVKQLGYIHPTVDHITRI